MIDIYNNQKNMKIKSITILISLLIFALPYLTINIGGNGLLMFIGIPILLYVIFSFNKNNIYFGKGVKILMLLLTYSLITSLWSLNSSNISQTLLKAYFIPICLGCVIIPKNNVKIVLFSITLSVLLICYFIYSGIFGTLENSERATIVIMGIIQDPNYLSLAFFPAMACLSYGFLKCQSIYLRCLCIILMLVIIYTELNMGCRGGTFCCILTFIFSVLCYMKINIQSLLTLIICTIILYAVIPYIIDFLPDSVANRFSAETLSSDGAGGRVEIWEDVINLVSSMPMQLIVGYGIGSTNYLIGMGTHNYLLQLLLEVGPIGVILFIRFVFYFIKRFWKHENIIAFSTFCSTIIMSMSLSVNTNFYFWTSIGVCLLLDYKVRNKF